jgi:hypothetical protein
MGNHFTGSNNECSKLGLDSIGHDKLDDGCNCSDRAVEAWSYIVVQEVDMCTCPAAGSSLIEVSCICAQSTMSLTL